MRKYQSGKDKIEHAVLQLQCTVKNNINKENMTVKEYE